MHGSRKYLLSKGGEMPHNGNMLQAYVDEHRTYQAALARAINRNPRTLLLYKKSHSIQTAILWELSHALKHNFFADLADALPETFSRGRNAEAEETAEEIAVLKVELTRLQTENNLLMRITKGGAVQ
jgi:hypothetical protein